MRRLAFVALAWAVTLSNPLCAQSLPSGAVVAQVTDSLARAFIAGGGAPSVAIAVVRENETLVMGGWGTADLEHDVPATERSVYRIGSITKQFTAAAVMLLAEEGKLELDAPIGSFLPALPEVWHAVTVRQLLNHTSGIPSYTDLGEEWRRRWGEEMSPDTIVGLTASRPMNSEPGSDFRYNNTGYVLLGMLVEKVAERPWAVFLEDRFFKPLGLVDTVNCLTEPLVPRRVRGYEARDTAWVNAPYIAMTQPYAAGALCSSVADLAAWNRALHTGGVVSEASYLRMTTPEGAATEGHYGFGLRRSQLARHNVVSHGGGIHGFISANVWIPDTELSVTVLTNSGSARAEDLLRQIARAALGVPLLVAPPVVPLPREEQARYTGVYALAFPGGVRDFVVAVGPDGLEGRLEGQRAAPLLHYGDDTFGAAFDPSLRLIFTVEDGRATALTLEQGGGRFSGLRR